MDWSPVLISMKTASLSIFITFFLGIFAAGVVIRLKNETSKIICDGILTLPLVLPPTVAGFFLLYLFGVKRPIGQFFIDFFGVKIAFSWGATVLAAVVMSFPLMYRSARGAFEQVDPDLTAAARTLGMSEWEIFWKVLFANATPGILSGGVLAFARGLGEFGATSMMRVILRERQEPYQWQCIQRWPQAIWGCRPVCGRHCGHCLYLYSAYESGSLKGRRKKAWRLRQNTGFCWELKSKRS